MILILDALYEIKGKNKIHIPTELNGKYSGQQYILAQISEEGIKGKMVPHEKIPHVFHLSQPLIEQEYIKGLEIHAVSDTTTRANLISKLKIMTSKR